MSDVPVIFTWDGDVMVPLPRFLPLCNRQYVVGERYRLVVHEERSPASHNHYFAAVYEGWMQLPDDIALRFPKPVHLRKWALCRTEYHVERKIACSSEVEARRIAAFIKPMDEYAEIGVNGNVVVEIKAMSQSLKAMGKTAFQDSKQKVLDEIAELIGISPDQLASNAGRAA